MDPAGLATTACAVNTASAASLVILLREVAEHAEDSLEDRKSQTLILYGSIDLYRLLASVPRMSRKRKRERPETRNGESKCYIRQNIAGAINTPYSMSFVFSH